VSRQLTGGGAGNRRRCDFDEVHYQQRVIFFYSHRLHLLSWQTEIEHSSTIKMYYDDVLLCIRYNNNNIVSPHMTDVCFL